MSIRFFAAAVATSAILLGGCQQSNPISAAPVVAVVNLDQVADALGRKQAMETRLQEVDKELRQEITAKVQDIRGELQSAQKAAGAEPNAEKQNELRRLAAEARQRLQRVEIEAGRKAQATRLGLIRDFRSEVAPVAQRIAAGKGAKVALATNEFLLWSDSSVDITQDVIQQMKTGAGFPEKDKK